MDEIKINIVPKNGVKCPSCGIINEKDTKFCIECGNKIQQKKITCRKCGALNRPGSEFCSQCGKSLYGKKTHKKKTKRKIVKKAYRGSKGVIKSAHSKCIRRTVKKETWHVLRHVDSLSKGKLRKLDNKIQHQQPKNNYGYLICDNCSAYFKLEKKVSPNENRRCICGGRLSYTRTLD